MRDEFEVEPKLIPGSGGVFDVSCNGRTVFSKHQTGRFPEAREVLDALHKLTL